MTTSRLDAIARAIEAVNVFTGRAIAWLTLLMVVVTVVVVILRYVFDIGWIWLQESVTWMHAVVFMLGAAYTLAKDEHVRVDVFYHRASGKRRALTDLLGAVFLLLPMALFIAWASWDYVASSWAVHETSRESGGLPGLFLLKSVIPLTAVLLCLQGIVQIIRCIPALSNGDAEPGEHAQHGAL